MRLLGIVLFFCCLVLPGAFQPARKLVVREPAGLAACLQRWAVDFFWRFFFGLVDGLVGCRFNIIRPRRSRSRGW